MRELAKLSVLLAIATVARAAAADCVKLRARAPLHNQPSIDAKAGAAIRSVVVFVEEKAKQKDWRRVRTEILRSHGDGDTTRAAGISFWVRARDARRARCPDGPTLHLMKVEGYDEELRWPDGRNAGWAETGVIEPAPGAAIETQDGAKPVRCHETRSFTGLRFRVCVVPPEHGTALDP